MDAVLQLFSHAGNCHNEWQIVLAGLGALPFVGIWFRKLRASGCKGRCSHD